MVGALDVGGTVMYALTLASSHRAKKKAPEALYVFVK